MSLKVLFAASECVPFVKTGGLADVVGALPKEILKAGHDIRVILPLYRDVPASLRAQMTHRQYFYVNLGWRRQYCGIEEMKYAGITFYFIDNEYYFGRPYVYGLGGDEGERFAFFSRAVLETLPHVDFFPDVLHCHDWQTGLIPIMLEAQYRALPQYQGIRTMFTIHNLQYQGIFPIGYVEDLVGLGSWAYSSDKLEFYGSCNYMKGGLTYAQQITTVSPSYAQEIQTPYYGERLDGLLRARQSALTGILNGIDTEEYNPETDPLISHRYSKDDLSPKALAKAALQEEVGLEVRADVPLIGMVGRLSGQKGLDLLEHVLSEFMKEDVQLVVLGKGEDKYADLLNWAQWKYPGKLAARIEMNHQLAHQIYAGADMFLMPSLFEPCGLSQMISLRYGTLPIVRETGGLRDTVLSYNEFTDEGNGFTFFNYNAHDMLEVIRRAISYYRDKPDIWHKLMRRAMQGSYGWDTSAQKYIELYRKMTEDALAKKAPPARKAAAKAEPGEDAPAAQPAKAAAAPRARAAAKPRPAKEKEGAAKAKPAPKKKPQS